MGPPPMGPPMGPLYRTPPGDPHGTPYVPTEGIRRVLREVGAPNNPPKHPLFCGVPMGTFMGPPIGPLHRTCP